MHNWSYRPLTVTRVPRNYNGSSHGRMITIFGWTQFSVDAWSWDTENVLRHLSRTFLLLVMKLFSKISRNSLHILQQFLPERPSLSYSLRPRPHTKTLITKSSQLNDRDFIIRSIYKDSYWLHLTLPARIWSSSKYTVLLTQYSCYNYAISICILDLLANCHLFYFISLHLTVRAVLLLCTGYYCSLYIFLYWLRLSTYY